jgi:hypothetical protein
MHSPPTPAAKPKRWIPRVLGAVLAICVGMAGLVGWGLGYLPVLPFSSARWKAPPEGRVRVHMVDAFLLTHRLRGMRRETVVALLGQDPPTGYFRDWDQVYWLGQERGLFAIDSEWLVLRYGPDGRVAAWRVVRD